MSLVENLARELGLSVRDVRRITLSAPKRYKTYSIPKRNGGKRVIAQPASEVKVLQRLVITRVLAEYPVNEAAYAYVKGRSIRQNALRHARSDVILKLDFQNFFNSIRPVDLERILLRSPPSEIRHTDFEDLYQLLFWGNGSYNARCLSIGAPSSPIVSNIVMYDFDVLASKAAAELGVTYTRYADDLTISSVSGVGGLLRFERRLGAIIKNFSVKLALNDEKRGIYGRGQRRMVTGLVITPDHKVSIGRERKRTIRAAVHRCSVGQCDDRELMYCKGMLGFVIAAEPSFLQSLIKTYGRDAIRSILKAPKISFYHEDVFSAAE